MKDPFSGIPRRRFRAALVDPPWLFKSNSDANPGRNARGHYRCMSVKDIAALPVKDLMLDDAVLFLWITGPFLALGAHLPIMKAWGFKPSGMGFVWVKKTSGGALATGGGFTTRKNAEFVLIGKRGRSVRRDAGVHEIIVSEAREHSRKPEAVNSRIERYCRGPWIELFARRERPGWTCWGDEVGKFSP